MEPSPTHALVLQLTRLDQREADAQSGNDRAAKLMNAYVAGEEAPLLAELDVRADVAH